MKIINIKAIGAEDYKDLATKMAYLLKDEAYNNYSSQIITEPEGVEDHAYSISDDDFIDSNFNEYSWDKFRGFMELITNTQIKIKHPWCSERKLAINWWAKKNGKSPKLVFGSEEEEVVYAALSYDKKNAYFISRSGRLIAINNCKIEGAKNDDIRFIIDFLKKEVIENINLPY